MTKLSVGQNDLPRSTPFWQKNSLVTLILFELWLLWYLAQSQILWITLYLKNHQKNFISVRFWGTFFGSFIPKFTLIRLGILLFGSWYVAFIFDVRHIWFHARWSPTQPPTLGGVHKLRWQKFAHYWPPTYPLLTFET